MVNIYEGGRWSSLILCVLCLCTGFNAFAQAARFEATAFTDLRNSSGVDAIFADYELYTLDINAVRSYLKASQEVKPLSLTLPGYAEFSMQLEVNPIKAANYVRRVATGDGIIEEHDPEQKTYKGYLDDGSEVRLTIDEGFFYGMIENEKVTLYFEPLRHFADLVPDNAFIIYKESDIIKKTYGMCQVMHLQSVVEEEIDHMIQEEGGRSALACKEVELALADDWLMFDKYNSVANVENHNLAVVNNVQTNYDDEFNHEVMFNVVEIWISTCSSCDPWTSSTDPEDLLGDFTNWGPTGFSETHDLASLWTDRDFDGPTIGLAWLNSVCGFGRYNVLEDFSSNASLLRCLQAHELGHNFSANHDESGSPYIMAPSVSNSNLWSSASQSQINNKLNNAGCLGPCPAGSPPVANFTANVTSGCLPLSVEFSDLSTNGPESWLWTFPGGTPSSSTDQNPTVTYHQQGTYSVTLEVTNSNGSDTETKTDYIEVIDIPVADFVAEKQGMTVTTTNLTQGAGNLTYFWDFGDGFTSTEFEPEHTYEFGGEYIIILTASNACGSDEYTQVVQIVSPPVAAFSASDYLGCAPMTVQFTNESTPGGNVNTYQWFFDGGTPEISSEENPIVVYEEAGIFDVELIVDNESGVDVLIKENLIEVFPGPQAAFGHAVNGLEVAFLNNSMHADSYFWDFGDGNTSTSENPVHHYAEGGSYFVTLIAENGCGSDTVSLQVLLDSAPLALYSVSENAGCAPFTVTFSNNSVGEVDFVQWIFPGGTPSSSEEFEVEVTYNAPGVYDVTLIVGNAIGTDTIYDQGVIEVFEAPQSMFTYDVNGTAVNFLNESLFGEVLIWQFGDGQTSVVENPVHQYDGDGQYEVLLIIEGECGLDTSFALLDITTPPTAGFVYDINAGCPPLQVEFSNTSSANATNFLWEFPGGAPSSSEEEEPVVTYHSPGIYPVSLTAWSGAGSDSMVIDDLITVYPLPEADFSTIVDGYAVDFQNQSEFADSYYWDFGDGNTSSAENPSHNFGSFGTYTISLISSNNCGDDTTQLILELSTAPIPLFSASETQGCVPFTVNFTDQSQNGVESWLWSFPGGIPDTSSQQNPVVTYEMPGIYSVILRVSNPSGTVTLVKEDHIVVGEEPVADFVYALEERHITLENLSEGGESYFWDFGDGFTSGNANPQHTFPGDGEYLVMLAVSNFCGSDTVTQSITVETTSVGEPGITDFTMQVFPNPNFGNFMLTLSGSTTEDLGIFIYDVLGKVVYERKDKLINGTLDLAIDIKDKQSGLYVIQVIGSRFQFNKTIVKQ